MSTLQDWRSREEFLAAFADQYKPDAIERWGYRLCVVLLIAAAVMALAIAYAAGAEWGW